ncbi:hypothetical protein ABZ703_28875, partial [Streptomyces massasporeus]|uniref:hypothetical protein n=1 Tax=Streptomyces massasporeus TaxID=67324 RepID=UPI0033C16BEC
MGVAHQQDALRDTAAGEVGQQPYPLDPGQIHGALTGQGSRGQTVCGAALGRPLRVQSGECRRHESGWSGGQHERDRHPSGKQADSRHGERDEGRR